MKVQLPKWALWVIAIAGFFASASAGLKGYQHLKSELKASVKEAAMEMLGPMVDTMITQKELKDPAGFRHALSMCADCEKEVVTTRVCEMIKQFPQLVRAVDRLNELDIDRKALIGYLRVISGRLWNELKRYETEPYQNLGLRYDPKTSEVYWMYDGLIFPAQLNTQNRKWYIETLYNTKVWVE